MSSSKEALSFGVLQKKSVKENITPHKIAVVLLILEYCQIRKSAKSAILTSRNKIDFCMLMLKLIQCPDLELVELLDLVQTDIYDLLPSHIGSFEMQLTDVYHKGVTGLLDIIQTVIQILVEPPHHMPVVNKSSVIGLYLRRIIVCMDKLSFSQVVKAYENFKIYYEKVHGREEEEKSVKETSDYDDDILLSYREDGSYLEESIHIYQGEIVCKDPWYDVNVGCWSRRQSELFIAQQAALLEADEASALPPPVLQERMYDLLKANPKCAEAHYLSYLNCMRVREFSGAVHSLHHCFDRSTVVAGSKGITQDEKNKGFRYAALNLAVMHAQFGFRNRAKYVLKEAIKMAHEANDNICLQHALTWLYKLSDSNKKVLIQRSILKCTELGLTYLASLGMQSLSHSEGVNGGRPSAIFELITESDALNCQHSYSDLIDSSYTLRAALWNLYGKTEIASLCSQMTLLLEVNDDRPDSPANNTEGTCISICNVASYLIHHGEYTCAQMVLRLARDRFPLGPLTKNWMLCEQILLYTRALYRCHWYEAEQAAKCMAPFDPWESKLRKIELYVAKDEKPYAQNLAEEVLTLCAKWAERVSIQENENVKDIPEEIDMIPDEVEEEEVQESPEPMLPQPLPSVQVRAYILLAETNLSRNPSASISYITSALSFAHHYHLEYLSAIAGIVMADIQLKMGLPFQALGVLEQCLPVILAHGSCYEKGRSMFLLVQCKLAASKPVKPMRPQEFLEICSKGELNSINAEVIHRRDVVQDCVKILKAVKMNFEKVNAVPQLKDVLILQTLLYGELGLDAESCKSAYEFRTLNTNVPLAAAGVLLKRHF